MKNKWQWHVDNFRQTTYVLIEVEECGHDSILDGSQIGLVPVDVEHPSYTLAAGAVTGDVLQEKGLLTAVGGDKRDRDKKGQWMQSVSF